MDAKSLEQLSITLQFASKIRMQHDPKINTRSGLPSFLILKWKTIEEWIQTSEDTSFLLASGKLSSLPSSVSEVVFPLIHFLTGQWTQPLHSSVKLSATSLPFLNKYNQESQDLLFNYAFLTCKKVEFHRQISRKLSNTCLCVLHTKFIHSIYRWLLLITDMLIHPWKWDVHSLLVRNPAFFWPCPKISNFFLP